MSNFERDLGFVRGASFFRDPETGDVKFRFASDPATVIGPRLARDSDQANYPNEWAAFLASEERSDLDRDASGGPGGSLPHDPPKRGRPRKA